MVTLGLEMARIKISWDLVEIDPKLMGA